ncbi:choice-of-anchor D domain-containing protein [Bacteroidetes/Chlorobi group bacterium ChocPot_Mid]|nr:MAG: choice-of-anchor D domain-containing protein [Bacteroidetes/Chlorobi group bacterium ChocPot_Mid]
MGIFYKYFNKIRLFLGGAFLVALTVSALSYSSGITGVTGPSQGCTCHGSANSNTSVNISSQSGNFTVNPNTTANFTLTVANSSQSAAGTNIAVKTSSSGSTNAGSLAPGSGSGLQSSNGELTHSSPKDLTSGQTTFDFSWTAPSTPGIYYLRAVGNAVNKNSQSSGDVWNFATTQQITVPGISVLTANGGENLCPGASYNITWSSVGVTNVKIELSSNGGSDFSTTLIANTNASTGSWTWNIPSDLTPGNQYKIRITDITDNNRYDISDANFTISAPTIINTHPVSQNVCSKQNIQFTVVATGGNLTYQWRKNGSNLSGKTSSTLAINNVQTSDAGSYDCVVTGSCGNPQTSQAANLSVTESPGISTHPSSQTKCPGENVTFTVTASGDNISYQWRKNGNDISGANTNTLTLNAISQSDAGNYSVLVSGTCNPPVISNNATLTVNSPPTISSQPQNQTTCEGASINFTVIASGSDLTFQWRKNTVNINNANSSLLIIDSVSKSDEGEYDVIVFGACNTQTLSNKVTLSVKTKPVISVQPQDQTVSVGKNISFSVSATESITSYQWRKNEQNINGAVTNILTLQNVSVTDSGKYDCVIKNSCGESVSRQAKLIVTENKLGPSIALLQKNVQFGTIALGDSKDTTMIGIIRNSGDETLVIDKILISGKDKDDFIVSSGGDNITLQPEQTKELNISFIPKSGGNKTAFITFESNSVNNDSIALNGFSAIYDLKISSNILDFGEVELGNKAYKELLVTNNSNINVEFVQIKLTGANSSEFKTEDVNIPFILNAEGGNKTIKIAFEPNFTGQATAQLELINNSNSNPLISLQANAIMSDIEELLRFSKNIVYPNPSAGNVIINIDSEFSKIDIINNLGNSIKTFSRQDYNFNIKGIQWDGLDNYGYPVENGYYIIIVSNSDEVTSMQLIIAR